MGLISNSFDNQGLKGWGSIGDCKDFLEFVTSPGAADFAFEVEFDKTFALFNPIARFFLEDETDFTTSRVG